jgi:DNA-3-methyladenine glycosylase I
MDESNWHHHKAEKPKNENEYFERMSRVIFMSGLNWRVLDKKWPGIQKAFANFDVDTVAGFQEPEVEEVMMSPDVIHNLPKVRAVIANAKEIQKVIQEEGSFEDYLSRLRKLGEDQLRETVSKRFAFLGKSTTVMFLFSVGEDLPKAHAEWRAHHQ